LFFFPIHDTQSCFSLSLPLASWYTIKHIMFFNKYLMNFLLFSTIYLMLLLLPPAIEMYARKVFKIRGEKERWKIHQRAIIFNSLLIFSLFASFLVIIIKIIVKRALGSMSTNCGRERFVIRNYRRYNFKQIFTKNFSSRFAHRSYRWMVEIDLGDCCWKNKNNKKKWKVHRAVEREKRGWKHYLFINCCSSELWCYFIKRLLKSNSYANRNIKLVLYLCVVVVDDDCLLMSLPTIPRLQFYAWANINDEGFLCWLIMRRGRIRWEFSIPFFLLKFHDLNNSSPYQ
jgi:hypothetical protein